MTFSRFPFKMSAYTAERVSHLQVLDAHNLGAGPEITAPFKLRWHDRHIHGVESRFSMPSLLFEDTEVARLGFRGTEGFMMVREGISEQVRYTLERRFQRLIETAKNNHKVLREEQQFLFDRFHDVFGRDKSKNAQRFFTCERGLIDSRNILHSAFLDTTISTRARSKIVVDVCLCRDTFKLSIPFLQISRPYGVTGKQTEWKFGPGINGLLPDSKRVREVLETPDRGVPEDIQTIIRTRVQEQKPVEVQDTGLLNKARKDWVTSPSNTGFSLHAEGNVSILSYAKTGIAAFEINAKEMTVLDMTSILRQTQVTTQQIESVIHDIVLSSMPRRKTRTSDDDWIRRLEATVSETDPGYF